MPRNPRAAVIPVRLAPQLKVALRAAAEDAGCSLNAYAVQVLAAAAGDPSRFRVASVEPTVDERVDAVRTLDRNQAGYPDDFRERDRHRAARNTFVEQFAKRDEGLAWLRTLDAQRPWHYVEWAELGGPLVPVGLD